MSRYPFLSACAALLVGACARPTPPPTDLGVSWELARYRARTIAAPEYEIDLTIPGERTEPIQGRSVIRFGWDDPDGFDLVLDFKDPERVSAPSRSTVNRWNGAR